MHSDVADLKAFYERPLGQAARRLLNHRIRARWRSAAGLAVMGLGYCAPYLGMYRNEAARVGALMPSGQGALVWPAKGDTLSVLVDEGSLPLPDNSVDRFLAVHILEAAEPLRPLMREIWRVLAPEGRIIVIAPNRRGLWARFDTTPFGQGLPFSRSQLEALLRDALFTPLDWAYALHMPPIDKSFVVRSATAWERAGAVVSPAFGGVIMVEARKELVAPSGKLEPRPAGRLIAARG